MAPNIHQRLRCVTAILFMTLHMTSSAKTNASPVYEVINEQPKADDRQIKTGKTNLPYGNPLAGNSQTNALLHAHNQQAMFNAERVRQHKAQLQRWTKTPLIDSYMRAYHESQENHQLALEQQQAKSQEKTQAPRQKEVMKKQKQLDPVALTEEDDEKERTRNHRSYGSVEYQLVKPTYHSLYYPATYSQVIKPNVVNEMVHSPTSKLYTGTADEERAYQKYYPAQDYESAQSIETLNSLLNKNPGDQLNGFNALINSVKANVNHDKELETPIDLYFYLKDPSNKGSEQYTRVNNDRKPIKEDVTEVEESKTIGFREHSNSAHLDPTTAKNIEYINSELTSQILSAGYNPLFQEEHSVKEEEQPVYQALQHGEEIYNHDNADGDLSDRYLHRNGVQHLNDDGTGVSAYDSESVSRNTNPIDKTRSLSRNRKSVLEQNQPVSVRNNHSMVLTACDSESVSKITNFIDKIRSLSRNRRSVLEQDQFVLGNNHSIESTESNVTDTPRAEPLIRLRPVPKNKRTSEFGTFLTTPNFAIGEAIDHNGDSLLFKRPGRNYDAADMFYDESDYDNFSDDFTTDYDYDSPNPKIPIIPQKGYFSDDFETYAPSENYFQNVNFNNKFTNYRPIKRNPISPTVESVYGSNNFPISPLTYGTQYHTSEYSIPHSLLPSVSSTFASSTPHLSEPVYLLTQTQLAKLIGHHNLNIEHLDVYQLSKNKRPNHYPRRYKKKSPHRSKQFRKNILKLHNLHII